MSLEFITLIMKSQLCPENKLVGLIYANNADMDGGINIDPDKVAKTASITSQRLQQINSRLETYNIIRWQLGKWNFNRLGLPFYGHDPIPRETDVGEDFDNNWWGIGDRWVETAVLLGLHPSQKRTLKQRRDEFNHLRGKLIQQLVDRDGYVCSFQDCRDKDITIDHIIPLSKGGSNELSNLRFLCRSHNSQKGDRHE